MIKQMKLLKTITAVSLALASSVSVAEVTITGENGVCTSRAGSGHKAAIVFFGDNLKNSISTTNEYQQVSGIPIAGSNTNVTFDVWSGNDASEGTCIGNLNIQITAGTNEAAQVALEDYLDTPTDGSGVMIRTGALDSRGKIDIYVDLFKNRSKAHRRVETRQVIWNNFVGMPNTSREMSALRFSKGEHLAFMYTGPSGTSANPAIQIFDNAGNFVGVHNGITVGSNSSFISSDVSSLAYTDIFGNPVDQDDLPANGEGYLKVLGLDAAETEASCMVIYTNARTDFNARSAWKNRKLKKASLTYARRNGGNDPLAIGQ